MISSYLWFPLIGLPWPNSRKVQFSTSGKLATEIPGLSKLFLSWGINSTKTEFLINYAIWNRELYIVHCLNEPYHYKYCVILNANGLYSHLFLTIAHRDIFHTVTPLHPPHPLRPPIKSNTWKFRIGKFIFQYQCHPVTFSTRFPFSIHFIHCKHKIEAKTWPLHTLSPPHEGPNNTSNHCFLTRHPQKHPSWSNCQIQ